MKTLHPMESLNLCRRDMGPVYLTAPGVGQSPSQSLETISWTQKMRVLQKDTGVESTDELATLMQDRCTWKSYTRSLPVGDRVRE